MTRRIAVTAVLLAATGCGSTYVDDAATTTAVVATTTVPVDPNAPLADLLDEIERLMSDLDERIIDQDGHVETLARIDELWRAAEERIRAADPDDVFNFEQAIELARSGVERRRPADASKGYKIIVEVIDVHLGA